MAKRAMDMSSLDGLFAAVNQGDKTAVPEVEKSVSRAGRKVDYPVSEAFKQYGTSYMRPQFEPKSRRLTITIQPSLLEEFRSLCVNEMNVSLAEGVSVAMRYVLDRAGKEHS